MIFKREYHSSTERDAISDLRVVDTCERARDFFGMKEGIKDYLNDQQRDLNNLQIDLRLILRYISTSFRYSAVKHEQLHWCIAVPFTVQCKT